MSDATPTNNASNTQLGNHAEFALSPEEEIFVKYLFQENMNRTRAYMRTYPSSSYRSACSSASRLLARAKVKAEVARQLEEGNVGNVIRRIALSPDGSGYIYLITSDCGRTKIGSSKNVRNRLAQINASSPTHVAIHHFRWVNQARELESTLHEKFSHCRQDGKKDWFWLSSEELAETMAIIDSHE